jgi:hypothetical protein
MHYGKMGIIILEDLSWQRPIEEAKVKKALLEDQAKRISEGEELTLKE